MSKRRFDLEETWRLCLSMWRWIAKQKRGGTAQKAEDLKDEWLRKKNIKEIESNCFFCEYDKLSEECNLCPGRLVDPHFDCFDDEYHYERKPTAFYNKLVSLNRKRKQ